MSSKCEAVKPMFNKQAAYMLQQARLFHTQLTTDLADFTALDSMVEVANLAASDEV